MEKIETLIENMISALEGIVDDAKKFDNGNKSAGTRVRKCMQETKSAAQAVREAISEIKNAEK